MTRNTRRKYRACLHRCEMLLDAGAGQHVPRSDRKGGWYPFPAGAQSRLDNRSKRTPADIRTVLVTERIDFGRPKGRRKIKYTRISRNRKISG